MLAVDFGSVLRSASESNPAAIPEVLATAAGNLGGTDLVVYLRNRHRVDRLRDPLTMCGQMRHALVGRGHDLAKGTDSAVVSGVPLRVIVTSDQVVTARRDRPLEEIQQVSGVNEERLDIGVPVVLITELKRQTLRGVAEHEHLVADVAGKRW